MPINLNGLLLPITTPFKDDEAVNVTGLTANLKKWTEAGVTGFVVLGSTGERVNLDEREYAQVIEAARAAVSETLTFIVGAGQQSTRGTINEIIRAASTGAAAVLVITPHYYRSAITQEALIQHYSAVADDSPVPIILSSMPDLTGVKIEPETAARLSEHPQIIGMKDSSNDVAKFAEAVRTTREDFAMLIGNGTVFYEALQAGARGGILAVGCAAPDLCLEIYRAFQSDELDRASSLQEKLMPLARAVTKTYGIGGLKAAVEMAGYVGGAVRAPLRLPNEEAIAEIAQLLKEANEFRGKPYVSEPGAIRGPHAGSPRGVVA
ncbi:MAG TPA: dihydrodipicolinate synthase family protein [Pyrinomonadaceae bacterium]|nr:dihydrodipicolinate synthase family protein [Pyrinomonadaceae bacterium]